VTQNKFNYMMWITYLKNHRMADRYLQLLICVKTGELKEVYLSELFIH